MQRPTRRFVFNCASASLVVSTAHADPLSDAASRFLSGGPDQETAARGLVAALSRGVSVATDRLGKTNGYFGDSAVRIPLPNGLEQARRAIAPLGGGALFDDLHKRLNRGAEKAAPAAKSLFLSALEAMTIEDAVGIVRGPQNAATLYFQGRTTPVLKQTFRPILARELDGAGAMRVAGQIDARLATLPAVFRPTSSAGEGLVDHGLDWALKGLFSVIGAEEAAIRRDPAKRTTEILRRVFG
jgi:hypothetical protein